MTKGISREKTQKSQKGWRWPILFCVFCVFLWQLGPAAAQQANGPKAPAVVELFEDDADAFIKQLNNDGGGLAGSDATREQRDVYSGVASIRVTPFQRFGSRIQGWNYPIVEKPHAGQYRYLRFAWKRVGAQGIMIQLHSNGSWNQRLLAGARSNQTLNWGPLLVLPDNNPIEWAVVTRDLFKDFGPMTLQGLALTPMEAGFGLFDHFYLGATIDDLDRASADAFGKTPLKAPLTLLQLGELWEDLARAETAPSGKAVRKLLAGRKESVPYLATMLRTKRPKEDTAKIARWIDELGDEDFSAREAAYLALDKLGDPAIPHLQAARSKAKSQEHRGRIEELLKLRGALDGALTNEQLRLIRAVRVLEWAATAESLQALEALTNAPPDDAVLPDIRAARERLAKIMKH
jgi:hypothetical protein